MKVRITRPCRVNLLSGEVEVNEQEFKRLMLLGLVEPEVRETPEKAEKQTRKAKK